MGTSYLKIGLALLVAALPGAAPAQALPAAPTASATIAVTAQGEAQAPPDTAIVELSLRGQNAGMKAAYAQAQAQAGQVRTILTQQGFAPAQARWTGYYVMPETDYRTHRIAQYTVSVRATLEVSDFTRLGPLLNAFGEAGLNALDSVRFELKNPAAAKAQAVAAAYRSAYNEAEALAQAAGRRLDGLESASVDASTAGAVHPIELMAARPSAPAPTSDLTPGPVTVSATVHAVYRMRP